jgi:hypothetical protein
MDVSIISALAALASAGIGARTSGLSGWMTQRILARTQWLEHEKTLRLEIYEQFIEKRRELIIFLSGAVAAWCRGAARQPAVWRRFPNSDPSLRPKNYI